MTEFAVGFFDLGHAYHPGSRIIRGCEATIEKGRILALLGPNGCGKTTLLKILLGALKPLEGHVTVNGQTAFVPQLFQVSFDFTVLEMVLMGRARKIGLFSQPSKSDERASLAALDRVGMADFARRAFHELSGGQRQLVILARALVAEADILILDEPTSALDLKNQALVLEWMAKLSREEGLTVVFTTHHPHHALAVADDVMLMLGPSRYIVGPAREAMTEENLADLYGVALKRIAFEHQGRSMETFTPVLPMTAALAR